MRKRSLLPFAICLLYALAATSSGLEDTAYETKETTTDEDKKSPQDCLIEETQEDCIPPAVAFYPLDKQFTTNDENNRPQLMGTAYNTAFTTGPYNAADGAYELFGKNTSYIEFPNGEGNLDVKYSITLMCWVRPGGQDGPLIDYKKGGALGVHISIVDGKFCNSITTYPVHNFFPAISTDQPLEIGKWVHVAATYNNLTGVNSIYVNGVLRKTQNIRKGHRIATNEPEVRVGVKDGDGRYFKGAITKMGVYDVALSAQQILAVRNRDKKSEQDSLIGEPEDGFHMPLVAAFAVVIGVSAMGMSYIAWLRKRGKIARQYEPL